MSGGERRPDGIEVVRDRTAGTRCDEGFLRVRRLVLRTRYADGTSSREYDYDVVSRRQPDAVCVVVWDRRPDGGVDVALRTGLRPPLLLRRDRDLVQPDPAPIVEIAEIVAGLLEDEDRGPGGVDRRAAIEVAEEIGLDVPASAMEPLGEPLFPSPGITDEKVHFRSVRADLRRASAPKGDGSVIEADASLLVLPLDEALARCRDGRIPDMKTEVALLRLRDRLTPSAAPRSTSHSDGARPGSAAPSAPR